MFDHVEPEVLNTEGDLLKNVNINPKKKIVDEDKDLEITCIVMLTVTEIMEVNRLVPVRRGWLKRKGPRIPSTQKLKG